MKKYVALSFTVILVGCGSVPHVSEIVPTSIMKEMPLASDEVIAPPPVVMAAPPAMVPPSPPEPVAKSAEFIPTSISVLPIEKHTIAKKMTALAGLVMNAAEAATESKKEIVTYDAAGAVATKVIEVNQASTAERLAQLLALLSGTFGLYVGVKKFRQKA